MCRNLASLIDCNSHFPEPTILGRFPMNEFEAPRELINRGFPKNVCASNHLWIGEWVQTCKSRNHRKFKIVNNQVQKFIKNQNQEALNVSKLADFETLNSPTLISRKI